MREIEVKILRGAETGNGAYQTYIVPVDETAAVSVMNLLDVKLRGDSLTIYHFVGKQFVLQLVGHRLGNDKGLRNGTRNYHFSDSTAEQ